MMKFEEEAKFVVDAFQPELIAASTLVNGAPRGTGLVSQEKICFHFLSKKRLLE